MKKFKLLIGLLGLLAIASCEPEDYYYADYLKDAEKVYPGGPDSLEIRPGYKQAELKTYISSDPRIKSIRIFWNDGADSLATTVDESDIGNIKSILIPSIDEGNYTFTVRTYDDKGNASVASEIYSAIYGDAYAAGLNNRIAESTGFDVLGYGHINFIPENTEGLIGVELRYKNAEGEDIVRIDSTKDNSAVLKDYKLGTEITFRAAFKPTENSLDTFYAQPQTIDKLADPALKNAGPITGVNVSSNIGTLVDWITTPNVKNFNANSIGGYRKSGTGYVYVTAGVVSKQNLDDIVNGKIYQSLPLAAGKYKLKITGVMQAGTTQSVYLVIAKDGNMPDTEELSSSIASALITGDTEIAFTLDKQTNVTLGIVANLTGTCNTLIKNFQLESLP